LSAPVRTDVGAALFATEGLFFRAGAETRAVPGASVSWLPGLTHREAGAVVHDVDVAGVGAAAEWIDTVESVLGDAGAAFARLYLPGATSPLDGDLRARGYRSRVEVGYAVRKGDLVARPDVALRPVTSDADWAEKLALHERAGPATGLHVLPADEWVAFERRRADAGVVHPHLVVLDGCVVGSIGAIWASGLPDFVRAKNLLVEPARRRAGVATSAAARLLERDEAAGRSVVGLYAVAGSSAEAMYRDRGWSVVHRQTEWVRAL
jgi:GNAT superfamily N-acetyltransferase